MARKDTERIAKKLRLHRLRAHLLVCTGGSCASKGEQKQALKEARRELKALGLHRGESRALCTEVGCLGVCRGGPIVVVWPDGTFYRNATPKNVRRIVREHVAEGRVVKDLCIASPEAEDDPPTGVRAPARGRA